MSYNISEILLSESLLFPIFLLSGFCLSFEKINKLSTDDVTELVSSAGEKTILINLYPSLPQPDI